MLDYLMSGGPFMFAVALFGLGALALNVAQIASRGRRDYTVLVIALTAAAFLTGVAGSGMGMYMAGTTLHGADAATIPGLFALASGIALVTTTFGALWAILNSLLIGVARVTRAS
jgi:hypothetical protein